jgi:hypothetical protein
MNEFKRIAKFEKVSQEEFLASCDSLEVYNDIKLPKRATVGSAVHTHTLNIYNYYNSTYHTKECSCGYSTLEAHEFVLALNAVEYAIKPSRRCIYCGYTTI